MPCLDALSPGTPSDAIPGTASGRRRAGNGIAGSALERHRRARIRPLSRPTAPEGTPSDGMPSIALGRQHGRQVSAALWGGAAQPAHAARRRSGGEIGAILRTHFGYTVSAIYRCGAADAQRVGPCARSTLVAPQRRPPILFFTRYDTMIRDSSH